jgi:hypothetical protein
MSPARFPNRPEYRRFPGVRARQSRGAWCTGIGRDGYDLDDNTALLRRQRRRESGLDRLDSVCVRVDDLVKDRRPPEAAALRAVLDKIINTNNPASMRSRPPPDQLQGVLITAWRRRHASDIVGAIKSPGKTT